MATVCPGTVETDGGEDDSGFWWLAAGMECGPRCVILCPNCSSRTSFAWTSYRSSYRTSYRTSYMYSSSVCRLKSSLVSDATLAAGTDDVLLEVVSGQ